MWWTCVCVGLIDGEMDGCLTPHCNVSHDKCVQLTFEAFVCEWLTLSVEVALGGVIFICVKAFGLVATLSCLQLFWTYAHSCFLFLSVFEPWMRHRQERTSVWVKCQWHLTKSSLYGIVWELSNGNTSFIPTHIHLMTKWMCHTHLLHSEGGLKQLKHFCLIGSNFRNYV